MHYELKREKNSVILEGKTLGLFYWFEINLKKFQSPWTRPMVYFRILPRTAHSATENSYDQALVLQLK